MRKIKYLLLNLIFLCNLSLMSQEIDSLKFGKNKELCEENLSVYIEFYKQKNYEDAFEPWSYLFKNAPRRTKNIYTQGPRIIRGILSTEISNQRMKELQDLLFSIYDQRNIYYPGQEPYVLGLKGVDMYKYLKGSTLGLKQSHDVLKNSFELSQNKTSASVLNYYFLATTKLVQAKELKVQDLIALFSDLSGVISYKQAKLSEDIYNFENLEESELSLKDKKKLANFKKELSKLENVKSNLEKTLAPHATCEKLIELYSKNYESKKNNIEWMKRAAKLLSKKECTDSDIFFTISEVLYNLEPSPQSAANMGIKSLKRKDYDKALQFYLYAYENESDKLNKALYAFRLAQTYGFIDQNINAKSYAIKASRLRSGWGAPYILIGDLYAKTSRKCGEYKTEFLKRVGYWAAIDKYEYAKKIDPSISNKVEEKILKYYNQIPSKTDIFQEGLIDVELYQIDCWYSEKVKIRVP